MDINSLIQNIRIKKSFLCVGLDPDLRLFPKHLLKKEDPVFEFNKLIIDVTQHYCVAYKPNLAFYEKLGASGWLSLEKTIQYIPDTHFVIADAKRSDVFNSAKMYADAFYDHLNCDAVTLSPYMGRDAVEPFLRKNKWIILLLATSNPSADTIQNIITDSGKPLYLELVNEINNWGSASNMMFVVGANRLVEMSEIRREAPNHFFLVPGVGAQGGSLEKVCAYGFSENCGLLVNSSRSIIYAGAEKDFLDHVRSECVQVQKKMEEILRNRNFI